MSSVEKHVSWKGPWALTQNLTEKNCSLTHYQTTNFRLFQTKRVCRRQFQIWAKWQKVIQMGRKHRGKRRNCSLWAISPFPTVVSKGLFPRGVIVWEWVKIFLAVGAFHIQTKNQWISKQHFKVYKDINKNDNSSWGNVMLYNLSRLHCEDVMQAKGMNFFSKRGWGNLKLLCWTVLTKFIDKKWQYITILSPCLTCSVPSNQIRQDNTKLSTLQCSFLHI